MWSVYTKRDADELRGRFVQEEVDSPSTGSTGAVVNVVTRVNETHE